MKLSRMTTGLSATEKALFYASKFTLIQSELNSLSLHWEKCPVVNNKVIKTDNGDSIVDVTCNKAGVELCAICEMNQVIYKEKRKLKAQLSKANSQLIKYGAIKVEGVTCEKVEDTFTDNLNSIKEEGEFKW